MMRRGLHRENDICYNGGKFVKSEFWLQILLEWRRYESGRKKAEKTG